MKRLSLVMTAAIISACAATPKNRLAEIEKETVEWERCAARVQKNLEESATLEHNGLIHPVGSGGLWLSRREQCGVKPSPYSTTPEQREILKESCKTVTFDGLGQADKSWFQDYDEKSMVVTLARAQCGQIYADANPKPPPPPAEKPYGSPSYISRSYGHAYTPRYRSSYVPRYRSYSHTYTIERGGKSEKVRVRGTVRW